MIQKIYKEASEIGNQVVTLIMTSIQYSFKVLINEGLNQGPVAAPGTFEFEAWKEQRLLAKLKHFSENRLQYIQKPVFLNSELDQTSNLSRDDRPVKSINFYFNDSMDFSPDDLENKGLSGIVNMRNTVNNIKILRYCVLLINQIKSRDFFFL